MNSNEESLKADDSNPTELKVQKRSSANQNNQYSLDLDTMENIEIIEIEDENEYLTKEITGTGHEQQDTKKIVTGSDNSC